MVNLYIKKKKKKGKLIEAGCIDTSKVLNIFERAKIIKNKLLEIYQKLNKNTISFIQPKKNSKKKKELEQISNETETKWLIGIEEFLKGFMGPHYRSRDLFTLAQINSLVSYDCIHIFKEVNYYIIHDYIILVST